MSTAVYNIGNVNFPTFRANLNAALLAAATNNSNGTAPSTNYPFQLWADTNTDFLKIRDETNGSTWYNLFMLNKAWGGLESFNAANGWLTFPNGIMIQWTSLPANSLYSGAANTLQEYTTTNFVHTFTNVYKAVATMTLGLDAQMGFGLSALTTTNARIAVSYPVAKTNFPIDANVIAIGTR